MSVSEHITKGGLSKLLADGTFEESDESDLIVQVMSIRSMNMGRGHKIFNLVLADDTGSRPALLAPPMRKYGEELVKHGDNPGLIRVIKAKMQASPTGGARTILLEDIDLFDAAKPEKRSIPEQLLSPRGGE